MNTLDCVQGACEWFDVTHVGYGQGISLGEDLPVVVQHRMSYDLVCADGPGGRS